MDERNTLTLLATVSLMQLTKSYKGLRNVFLLCISNYMGFISETKLTLDRSSPKPSFGIQLLNFILSLKPSVTKINLSHPFGLFSLLTA